jgi:hypothetical protein
MPGVFWVGDFRKASHPLAYLVEGLLFIICILTGVLCALSFGPHFIFFHYMESTLELREVVTQSKSYV